MTSTGTIKVNYVTQENESAASYRLRIALPLLNFSENIVPVLSDKPDLSADIFVFQKHFGGNQALVDAAILRDMGKTVVFDVAGDHFDKELQGFYKEMCRQAAYITVPTEDMAIRVKEHTGKTAWVIPDAASFTQQPVYLRETGNPVLGWHGHCSNIFTLLPHIQYIKNKVIIITNNTHSIRRTPSNVDLVEWNLQTVEKALAKADIVFIPQNDKQAATNSSPNRIVDSIRAGKFVVTNNELLKQEFGEFIFIGDLEDGIKYYVTYPDFVKEAILAGQKYINETYSPKVVGQLWEDFFLDISKPMSGSGCLETRNL